MIASADAYADEIHNQLKRYTTWLPTDPVKVGDVGQLRGNIFTRVTDLDNLGISAEVVKDPKTESSYKFMSAGTRELAFEASTRGRLPASGSAAARLKIEFSSASSVYLFLTNCSGYSFGDLVSLGKKILGAIEANNWLLDFVVVTRVVEAGSATIFQSAKGGASVELNGDASGVAVLDLLSAGTAVRVKSQRSVGLSVVAKKATTPLLSLGKVRFTFLDRILRSEPRFSCNISSNSINMRNFCSHVDGIQGIDMPRRARSSDDLMLKVKLPKYGDHVDISDLFDLAERSFQDANSDTSSPLGFSEPKRTLGPFCIDPALGARVHRSRFLTAVRDFPYVDLDDKLTNESFIALNLKLPRSGDDVSIEPLLTFTSQAADPKARATVKADLSFDEIP